MLSSEVSGLIENVELVSQIEPETGEAFRITRLLRLLNLAAEGEQFDWGCTARRILLGRLRQLLSWFSSWQDWVSNGAEAVNGLVGWLLEWGLFVVSGSFLFQGHLNSHAHGGL